MHDYKPQWDLSDKELEALLRQKQLHLAFAEQHHTSQATAHETRQIIQCLQELQDVRRYESSAPEFMTRAGDWLLGAVLGGIGFGLLHYLITGGSITCL